MSTVRKINYTFVGLALLVILLAGLSVTSQYVKQDVVKTNTYWIACAWPEVGSKFAIHSDSPFVIDQFGITKRDGSMRYWTHYGEVCNNLGTTPPVVQEMPKPKDSTPAPQQETFPPTQFRAN